MFCRPKPRPSPSPSHCPPGTAPKPQPCPSHKNHTFCPSDTSAGQCDHPPKPSCPPCPPGPTPPPAPPLPPPLAPAPPPGEAYKLWVRSPNYNKTTWRINRPGQQSTDYYFFSPGTTATNSTRPSATEQQQQEQEQQQEQVQLRGGGGGGGGGGRIARVVALYREATGHAPMPPKAILGFTMSKDRYKSQAELLTAARGFRSGKKTNVFGAALFYTLTAPPPPPRPLPRRAALRPPSRRQK
eukprot:COSAG06_NODE_9611_length_1858_cov_15.403638_1_plen_240_part_10